MQFENKKNVIYFLGLEQLFAKIDLIWSKAAEIL